MRLFKKKKNPEELDWLLQIKASMSPEDSASPSKKKKLASPAAASDRDRAKLKQEREQIKEIKEENIGETKGQAKVARLLLALGPQKAADILQHLQSHEIEEIMSEMSKISSISAEERKKLLKEFYEKLDASERVVIGGKEEARQFLLQGLGEEKAQGYLEKLDEGDTDDDLDFIERTDPKSLVQLLEYEHEQIIAVILTFLSPKLAATVLRQLREDQREKIVKRLAHGSHVHPHTMQRIIHSLKEQLLSQKQEKTKKIGGARSLAHILSFMNLEEEKQILSFLDNDEIQDNVRSYLYTFEELLALNDREMRVLINEIKDNMVLVSSLRACSPEIRNHFFNNISKNRARDVSEAMELRGAIRQNEIFQARDEIVMIARKLDEEGRIQIKKNKEKWI